MRATRVRGVIEGEQALCCASGQGLSNYHRPVGGDTGAGLPADICAVVS